MNGPDPGSWLPTRVPRSKRTLVMIQHLAPLSGLIVPLPFMNILGALVAWLTLRDRHPVLDDQGKEALNFQLSLTLYFTILGIVCVVTLGIGFFLLWPLLLGLYVWQIVALVLAVIAANEGRTFRYRANIRFLK